MLESRLGEILCRSLDTIDFVTAFIVGSTPRCSTGTKRYRHERFNIYELLAKENKTWLDIDSGLK